MLRVVKTLTNLIVARGNRDLYLLRVITKDTQSSSCAVSPASKAA